MIKCVLTLCPGGVEGKSEEHLGTIYIDNQIARTLETGGSRGDYNYKVFKKLRRSPFMKGQVKDFPRLSYHPWNLIYRVLEDVMAKNGGKI